MTKCQRCGGQHDNNPINVFWHTRPVGDGPHPYISRCQVGLDKFCEAPDCGRIIYNWQIHCGTHQGGNYPEYRDAEIDALAITALESDELTEEEIGRASCRERV